MAEDPFRHFLGNRLPGGLAVGTGVLVDSSGRSSRQLDVIIFDRMATPVLHNSAGLKVIPVECAYAVIEVKTKLSVGGVESIWENMISARQLAKTAYYRGSEVIQYTFSLYGKSCDIWPLNYFVFAYESEALSPVAQRLHDYQCNGTSDPSRRVDCCCALNKGVICNQKPDGTIDALPSGESRIVSIKTPDALLLYYTLVMNYLSQAKMTHPFRFRDYLPQIEFGVPEPVTT